MAKVYLFNGRTTLKTSPERIFDAVSEVEWEDVVVLGFDKEGHERFFSNNPDGGDVLWLLERMKLCLLTAGEEE